MLRVPRRTRRHLLAKAIVLYGKINYLLLLHDVNWLTNCLTKGGQFDIRLCEQNVAYCKQKTAPYMLTEILIDSDRPMSIQAY